MTWLDSSVHGMGRGAGNTNTEHLLIERSLRESFKLNISPIIKLINNHFEPLRQKYQWGANPYYYIDGKEEIHPSFVYKISNDPRYTEDEILNKLEHLKEANTKQKQEKNILFTSQNTINDTFDYTPRALVENKEVLLVAPGPRVKQFMNEIHEYIKTSNVFVISLNHNTQIDFCYVDALASCHPLRLKSELNDY